VIAWLLLQQAEEHTNPVVSALLVIGIVGIVGFTWWWVKCTDAGRANEAERQGRKERRRATRVAEGKDARASTNVAKHAARGGFGFWLGGIFGRR
jgi:type VI protein secretion system component VasK